MRRLVTWLFLGLLVAIHTVDLELTTYYIGNDATGEAFPPMSWAIGRFGVSSACWLSRAVMYPYFWLALVHKDRSGWFYFLVLATVLYYAAMVDWLFTLDLANWPLPPRLRWGTWR